MFKIFRAGVEFNVLGENSSELISARVWRFYLALAAHVLEYQQQVGGDVKW